MQDPKPKAQTAGWFIVTMSIFYNAWEIFLLKLLVITLTQYSQQHAKSYTYHQQRETWNCHLPNMDVNNILYAVDLRCKYTSIGQMLI